jgi:AraC-like DNA-binding protein
LIQSSFEGIDYLLFFCAIELLFDAKIVFLSMTFGGRFLLSMINYAGTKGLDFKQLLAVAGHDFEFLCEEESRVSAETYNRVIEFCVIETEDDFFGLHAGEFLNLSAAGLIGQITQTSSTVKQALDYCCEFANLGCRALPMELEEEGDSYRLNFIADPLWEKQSEVSVKQTIDGVMAFSLREFHLLTRQKYFPKKVGFAFSKPNNFQEYERIFKCPIEFNANRTFMLFDAAHVNAKVVTSDFNLLRVLVAHATEKLAELEGEVDFYHQVKKSIVNLIKPDFPTIDTVAANLNTSVRTLQRKLKEEDHTFKDIIESLRQEMAFNYLKKEDLSIKEIAILLNYSDSSAFVKSFKKWTGKSPSEFRANL